MGWLDSFIIPLTIAPASSLDELEESIQKDYKEDEREKSSENHDNNNIQDEQANSNS